jgi:putative nucleotidyltransferase with HDIG domain
MAELDDFIERAKHLPPAPTILPELITLLGKPNLDSSRVVALITYDPALTANVLRLCNSGALASATPVTHLDEAVVRLGFNEIYRLVAGSSAVRALAGSNGNVQQQKLWSHSVLTAVGAQWMARRQADDENLAFTTGLLHDIGKLVMADVLQEKYLRLLQEVEDNRYSLIQAEQRILGLQHAELGGRLLARWKFPLNLVAGVCFHHNPTAAAAHQKLSAYVYVGNLIAYMLDFGCGNPAALQRSSQEVASILPVAEESISEIMESIRQEFAAVRQLIQLG